MTLDLVMFYGFYVVMLGSCALVLVWCCSICFTLGYCGWLLAIVYLAWIVLWGFDCVCGLLLVFGAVWLIVSDYSFVDVWCVG